jgi:hypothetical protein
MKNEIFTSMKEQMTPADSCVSKLKRQLSEPKPQRRINYAALNIAAVTACVAIVAAAGAAFAFRGERDSPPWAAGNVSTPNASVMTMGVLEPLDLDNISVTRVNISNFPYDGVTYPVFLADGNGKLAPEDNQAVAALLSAIDYSKPGDPSQLYRMSDDALRTDYIDIWYEDGDSQSHIRVRPGYIVTSVFPYDEYSEVAYPIAPEAIDAFCDYLESRGFEFGRIDWGKIEELKLVPSRYKRLTDGELFMTSYRRIPDEVAKTMSSTSSMMGAFFEYDSVPFTESNQTAIRRWLDNGIRWNEPIDPAIIDGIETSLFHATNFRIEYHCAETERHMVVTYCSLYARVGYMGGTESWYYPIVESERDTLYAATGTTALVTIDDFCPEVLADYYEYLYNHGIRLSIYGRTGTAIQ